MNKLEDLLSGIGVVIDEKINIDNGNLSDLETTGDPIQAVINQLEGEWNLPFIRLSEHGKEETWPQLLKGASFIILDWKLWDDRAGGTLREYKIQQHVDFLKEAKNYFVPVIIFTNENPTDIEHKLTRESLYKNDKTKDFIFVKPKSPEFNSDDLQEWIESNASVYTLKSWEQSFYEAKKELFCLMYERSPDWPKVFWKGYKDDGVDPGYSLTSLVNDNLTGRMRTNMFDRDSLEGKFDDVDKDELKALIGGASFQANEKLPENDIRCGDLFNISKDKFLINLRPDCDCVPRNGEKIEDVQMYCIEGKTIRGSQLSKKFHKGQLTENISESIAFSIYNKKSIRFDFSRLQIKEYGKLKSEGDGRVGRLLHPYITRIQQRYSLYLQRQGMPRIPENAIHDEVRQ